MKPFIPIGKIKSAVKSTLLLRDRWTGDGPADQSVQRQMIPSNNSIELTLVFIKCNLFFVTERVFIACNTAFATFFDGRTISHWQVILMNLVHQLRNIYYVILI